MEGIILGIDRQKSEIAIKTPDGRRVYAPLREWKGTFDPQQNMKVDFDLLNGQAAAVYPTGRSPSTSSTKSSKSRPYAILFALFLGSFGGHKFYLDAWGWGIVHILFFWTWIPAIVSIIETVRYILMTDDEFSEKTAAMDGPFAFLW